MTDRFARQRLIPGWDQDRLKLSTAVVVGVGALGNEVAKNLALAGLGRLVLCDPDTVAVSNLSRTVLFGPDDVGQPKAAVAAAALRRLAPGLSVDARIADLVTGVGLGELADAALVMGCVDTVRARIQLLGRCALVDAPLLDGGTQPWGGEVRIRLSAAEACYACTLTPHRRGTGDLPWSCSEPAGGGPQAAAIPVTALTAAWQVLIGLRVLFGDPPAYRVLSIDAATGHTAPVTIGRDPDCPLHRPLDGPVDWCAVDHRATVAEFLAALPPGSDPQAWRAFALPAGCRRCGARARPVQAGQAPACDRCGARVRVRSTQRIRDADPRARLLSLGIAPGEIIPTGRRGGELGCHRLRSTGPLAETPAMALPRQRTSS